MGAYKQFLSSDIIVTPFEVNKSFTFLGASSLTSSDAGIDRFLGTNIQSNPFISGSNPSTGYISTLDQELVYNSAKQLYYSNYLDSNYGDSPYTSSLIPGFDTEGDTLVGVSNSNGRFDNFLQTSLTYYRYFPTSSNSIIGIISIPSKLYGNYIQPGTFYFSTESGSIQDDGNGNVYFSLDGGYVGNIIYSHGLVILTQDNEVLGGGRYGSGIYGTNVYGGDYDPFILNFISSSNVTCSFSSSLTIYETQYKCTLRENEFNFSLNPSLISGSTEGTPYDFVTGSYFSPYVTTVGLYDDNQNLLAVGKLSQPLPTSATTDTTILINIDR
jgi:hypothetical protein